MFTYHERMLNTVENYQNPRPELLKILRKIDKENEQCWPFVSVHSRVLRQLNKIEKANGAITDTHEWLECYESIAKELVNKEGLT